MPAYIPITEAQTDPGAPGTSELWKQWRDNPIAIAEGAVGAPRIAYEALEADLSLVGQLGTYAMLGRNISPGVYAVAGATIAGSQLQYASVQSVTTPTQVILSGSNPDGTWRCMGHMENTTGGASNVATMWMRIL
jgi:hypothetical protein